MNKNYILVATSKNKKHNIIEINNKERLTLKDIDLYTLNFKNKNEFIDYLYDNNKIEDKNSDIFIFKFKNNIPSFYEVLYLYKDSRGMDIINYINEPNFHIINKFIAKYKKDPKFRELIDNGRSNVYKKFTNYFNRNNYEALKYKEGLWARESYNLNRNIIEFFNRYDSNNININMDSRYKIMDDLLEYFKKDHIKGQLTIQDYLNDKKISLDDKKISIINFLDDININIIKKDNNKLILNKELFKKDIKLSQRFLLLLNMYTIYKYNYEEYNDYKLEIEKEYYRKEIINKLKKDNKLFNKMYEQSNEYFENKKSDDKWQKIKK